MPIRLHINIDHVATLRNARGTRYPDPLEAALVCERAGADGITVHLREDRRHILDRDVERLRETVTTLLNLEMAATTDMLAIALRIRPDVVTLVPERREERTTEGGLSVASQRAAIHAICSKLTDAGIKPSLFIGPDAVQIDACREVGAVQVELHTGSYCDAEGRSREAELSLLMRAAARAHAAGLEVAAGHGLTRHNVASVAAIPELQELNIGHAVIADALFSGLDGAVRDLRVAVDRGVRLRRA
jgi:pyridoxine 5-phosphate synthase